MNGMKIEKAIKILEPYKKSVFGDASEKYGGSISVEEIIELLKEQEAVYPIKDMQWLEAEKRPSSTMFICPHCREMVYFSHGSSSKARRRGLTKRCLYKFCPWCGKEVTPLRINYISD